jgi:membrane protein DedA with SNARE-associated domain
VTNQLIQHGLILLFILVALESAGIPLPGETALIAAAVLANRGHYSIVWVILLAAAAAILGDNIGYWIGRKGGRKLLQQWKPMERWAERVLPPSERFFRRHGAKTVFFGRFFAVLRVTAAWLAGVGKMHWWQFFMWNAAGGICWALLVGIASYYGGHAAGDAINRYGLIAAVVLGVLLVGALVFFHFWKRRIVEET